MWYVVKFTEENTVSVVPNSWYLEDGGKCFWPPKEVKALYKRIKNKSFQNRQWSKYSALILGAYGMIFYIKCVWYSSAIAYSICVIDDYKKALNKQKKHNMMTIYLQPIQKIYAASYENRV